MKFKWRKWNNILHRDLGYVFAAMTVIYAVSGIALNHTASWNPNYIISHRQVQTAPLTQGRAVTGNELKVLLPDVGIEEAYKSHFFPTENTVKVFFEDGTVSFDMQSGNGVVERVTRRPLFYEINFLHYNNPGHLWTWFSDIFCVALVILAVTGLFVLKGKKGITGSGAWLTAVGIIIPIVFLITVI